MSCSGLGLHSIRQDLAHAWWHKTGFNGLCLHAAACLLATPAILQSLVRLQVNSSLFSAELGYKTGRGSCNVLSNTSPCTEQITSLLWLWPSKRLKGPLVDLVLHLISLLTIPIRCSRRRLPQPPPGGEAVYNTLLRDKPLSTESLWSEGKEEVCVNQTWVPVIPCWVECLAHFTVSKPTLLPRPPLQPTGEAVALFESHIKYNSTPRFLLAGRGGAAVGRSHQCRLCLSRLWLAIWHPISANGVPCAPQQCLLFYIRSFWIFHSFLKGDFFSLLFSDLDASWLCVWLNSALLVFRAQHQAPMRHPSQHCLCVCLSLQLTHAHPSCCFWVI